MIYLDNHATTPCDPAVVERMMPYFSELYGNAASSHRFGEIASWAVDRATEQVASLIGASPDDLIFTSGATESNNLAILGTGKRYLEQGIKRKRVVTISIEHKSVLAPMAELSKLGFDLHFLPTNRYGRIDLEAAKDILNEETLLVSIQLANSEIGTIQPIKQLSEIAHDKGILVHCDASQGIGRIEFNLNELNVDMCSISAHKIYGPKGIGVLWVKNGCNRLISPLMFGGDSKTKLRPGTINTPLVVGFGEACDIIVKNFENETMKIRHLRDFFENQLTHAINNICINGDRHNRLCNNSNMTFPLLDAESILSNTPDIIASTGSACESGSLEPSRILLGIGLSREAAYRSIRFGFGRYNTKEQVAEAALLLSHAYEELM